MLTWAVLGTGPSLTKEAVASLKGRCGVIAVNDAYRLCPWADVLYAADRRWWMFHAEHLANSKFAGRRISIEQGGRWAIPYGVELMKRGGEYGFDDRPTHLRTGRNSAYQAAHLAAHLGAKRILLVGCDMKNTKGRSHFFGEHPPGLRSARSYADWIERFRDGAGEFNKRGIELVNCCIGGGLSFLPTMSIEQALCG